MSEPRSRNVSRIGLTVGVAASAGGLWLLLNAVGVTIPPFRQVWPALLILAGLGALADYLFLSRRSSAAGWFVGWIGLGVLGFALSLGYTEWRKVLDWLPSFPTIFGLALLTTWVLDRKSGAYSMAMGLVFLAFGLVGFAARFEFLQHLLPRGQVIWAIVLLAGGGFLAWKTVRGMRSGT